MKHLQGQILAPLLIVIFLTSFFLSSAPLSLSSALAAPPTTAADVFTLDEYLAPFYDRYSQHFDEFGWKLQLPLYGIRDFLPVSSARDLMSVAAYYKYRALRGDRSARQKIREAILNADTELTSRPPFTQSFEDAAAQFLMLRLIEQIPDLLTKEENITLYKHLLYRLEEGIRVQDTENRAALAAVYWRYILDFLVTQGLVPSQDKRSQLNILLDDKVLQVFRQNVDRDGWYTEGNPRVFSSHYHLVTAFSFFVYGRLSEQSLFTDTARKMTQNLRKISFRNGMVEAGIGKRPVGNGAQFYLGLGLLNAKFGFPDYGVYLGYASNNRFFSDVKHPNRLEYHATQEGASPLYHDDIAFSNLAELALIIPGWSDHPLVGSKLLKGYPLYAKENAFTIINHGDIIWVNETKIILRDVDHTRIRSVSLPFSETIFDNPVTKKSLLRPLYDSDRDGADDDEENLRRSDPYSAASFVLQSAGSTREYRYGKIRLKDLNSERHQAFILKNALEKIFGSKRVPLPETQWIQFVNAYIYGRYTVDEIAQTIRRDGRIVHRDIPATLWRKSQDYRRAYLDAL